MNTATLISSHPFYCEVPPQIHPLCDQHLAAFMAGDTSVHTPAYVCNMVDSSLIPLVECLLEMYADGVLVIPLL